MLDFQHTCPPSVSDRNSALMIIVNGDKEDHMEMLEGGVMRQLLQEKWKTFAKVCVSAHREMEIVCQGVCDFS